MTFKTQLIPGKLIKRYKRFLADVILESGETVTVHCPNSGSMRTCAVPGWDVLLSRSDNPTRKYPLTWEMVHNGTCWIGINTGIPNLIAAEAAMDGTIPELAGYDELRREVRYGQNSRIDLLLESSGKKCFVEVKNVTLVEEDGHNYFPDAVTERGKKHLLELTDMVRAGHRAVMLFVIQRSDGDEFRPAGHIDPAYADALQVAAANGVELLAYQANVSPKGISIQSRKQLNLAIKKPVQN